MRIYLFLLAFCFSFHCLADELRISASADVASELRHLAADSAVVIEHLRLDSAEESISISLKPMVVFTPQARIVIHQSDGTTRSESVPDSRWFAGQIVGRPGSRVIVSLHSRSGMRGLLFSDSSTIHFLTGDATSGVEAGLLSRQIDTDSIRSDTPFACGNSLAPAGFGAAAPEPDSPSGSDVLRRAAASQRPIQRGGPTFWAKLALETDTEYLNLFDGDTVAAAEYAGDLVAYTSLRYQDETDTGIAIGHLSLWETPDPWTQSGSFCQLLEFGRYWNENNAGVDRTIAHFLSGRGLGGGIAWVGVLCQGGFNYNHGDACPGLSPQTSNYGGDYGVSGSIAGDFDIDNPAIINEIVLFAHELGHNFNSPHTHCYAGLGGSSEQVDECSNSQCGQGDCYCGSTSLPGGQPSGSGAGTLMSYCHLRPGGIANISWTLGQGHPHGVQPERVPSRMIDHIEARSTNFPGCLDVPLGDEFIFADQFENLAREQRN